MSAHEGSVLYDAPGPRARRRALVGSLVVTGLFAVVVVVAVRRLSAAGQLSWELWGPVLDPRHEVFDQVWRLLRRGLLATLVAAALAIAFSLTLGTLLGVGRMMLGRRARMPLAGVTELLRGLPVVIGIYFASRVLPDLGLDLEPLPGPAGLWYLVIGLTVYNMVVIAEIVRAGVAALPQGQREAAASLGLTPWATMRLVLLPQGIRVMLPALISQLVVILKDTSLAAVLGLYTELLRQANLIAQNLDNRIPMLTVVGVVFVVMNAALGRLAVRVERRLSRARTTPGQPLAPRTAPAGQGA